MFVLKIDGLDITPYIASGGVKWQRSDLDGPGAGRTLDSKLRRNRIGSKIRLDVTCRPLTTSEASIVLTAIMPEWVTVEYTDPQIGGVTTRRMYANNNPASIWSVRADGVSWWNGITFPLIEE